MYGHACKQAEQPRSDLFPNSFIKLSAPHDLILVHHKGDANKDRSYSEGRPEGIQASLLLRLPDVVSMIRPTSLFLNWPVYRHCHRKVSLTGTGRSESEYDHLFTDCIDVFFLTECLRLDRFSL